MPNHLADETSPYLLQHANNPVDWYPWSEVALAKARDENKPIFLSIGYSACHWCHVMAHESFENPETARLMNEFFVNIKVDREERPDLDSIYMSAVVALTRQGGWPMSVFLTPDGRPFYGGTYFPPKPRYGMPAFSEVLNAINRVWQANPQQILQTSEQLTAELNETTRWEGTKEMIVAPSDVEDAAQTLKNTYDWQYGGWGHAPRFPAPMTIDFLLQRATRGDQQAKEIAVHLLLTMQAGGLYDIVGGGFHRYSTDDFWLVPHFEKMLYDNAQLSLAYLHAYQITGEITFRNTCEETLDFLIREMRHAQGGFFSSLDADSEGEEGQFYLWTLSEIETALKQMEPRELFLQLFSAPPDGNFEGKIILKRHIELKDYALQTGSSLADIEQKVFNCKKNLLTQRNLRQRPGTDDKVLTVWNAFTLRSLAEAAGALDRIDYLDAAESTAKFLFEHLYKDGKLFRSWRAGQARIEAYLEDYAALILALLTLYQADFNPRWYQWAEQLAKTMIDQFTDPAGGFFDTQAGTDLFIRPKDMQDNATPTGNALAAMALLKLSELNGNQAIRLQCEQTLGAIKGTCGKYPTAFSFWLQAMDFSIGPIQQVALIWPAGKQLPTEMLETVRKTFRPRTMIAAAPEAVNLTQPELLRGRLSLNGAATAYICQGFVCHLPVNTPEDLQKHLV